MSDISIVIVSYNVKSFLQQCLESIDKARGGLDINIYVVDNNSVDGTREYLHSLRDENLQIILNDDNVGFSTANNQAIRISNSKYILLLNPDTVIQEDTLIKCFDKMQMDQEIGALGVKLIDGSGEFLVESKRGFPSLWASFTKMTGISKLAPRSEFFNAYYLGHLDPEEENEIDVLCGAFMMVRSSILPEVGFLDEQFFMYGEDIDWSYRIQRAGHKIYYLPTTSIIHYKGESTKKTSISYLKIFYNAMIIFLDKHFHGTTYSVLKLFLRGGIYLRGALSAVKRVVKKGLHPLLDAGIIFLILWCFKDLWATLYFGDPDYFDDSIIFWNIIGYLIIWLGSLQLFGNYDRRSGPPNVIQGVIFGFVFIVLMYSILPENLRSSRMLILIGLPLVTIGLLLVKRLINIMLYHTHGLSIPKTKHIAIIGSEHDIQSIESQVRYSNIDAGEISKVELTESDGNIKNLARRIDQMIKLLGVNELIFSSQSLRYHEILQLMQLFGSKTTFKIAAVNQKLIIGSDSKDEMGQSFTMQMELDILLPVKRRMKRLLDFVLALFTLITFPITYWISKGRIRLSDIISIIFGRMSWVGVDDDLVDNQSRLNLKKSVFTIKDTLPLALQANLVVLQELNLNYIRFYSIWKDLDTLSQIFFKR